MGCVKGEDNVDRVFSMIKDKAKVSPQSLAKAGQDLSCLTLGKWGVTDPEDVVQILDGLRAVQSTGVY